MEKNISSNDRQIEALIGAIKQKIGHELLNEEEIVTLCAEEISRTYTHEEKNYSA